MYRRRDYESRPCRLILLKSKGQTKRELSALMSWLVVFMTVIFPLLLVMDLVDLDPKQIESPLLQGKDKIHHV